MSAEKSNLHLWMTRLAAWFFGGLFVFSGWVKVLDPGLFLMSIRGFNLIGDPHAAWLALALPWLEVFAGMAVLTGWLRRGGLILLTGCIAVFIGALGLAWSRGLDVDCGCFGNLIKTSLGMELTLDVVLLAMGLWLLKQRRA
jgi:uncharacterized membrane protein YphA (DoxX/SURF4 family)